MERKIQVSDVDMLDLMKFVSMTSDREEAIEKFPATDVKAVFASNEKAKALHPDYQKMIIEKVIAHDGAGAKTFVMRKTDGTPAAYFRAGQYLSVSLNIGTSSITRPYSISSSPRMTLEGRYELTIKRVPDGFATNYILDNWTVGTEVTVSGGEGQFYYEPMRDAKNVVALAGGSGITPFLSMAQAICDGIEDFNLTVLFGSRNEESILFKNEFEAISKACPKVKVIHILSDEDKTGYEHGFITAEIIKKYSQDVSSIFICGPEAMYRFVEKEVNKLGLKQKYVRRELLGVTKKVWEQPGYPTECKDKTFKLKVIQYDKEYVVEARADEAVIVAIERAGIAAPSRCRSGECGWCHSKLLSGKVYIPEESDGRRHADKIHDYIHPCASFPISDLIVEVPGVYQK